MIGAPYFRSELNARTETRRGSGGSSLIAKTHSARDTRREDGKWKSGERMHLTAVFVPGASEDTVTSYPNGLSPRDADGNDTRS